MSAPIGYQCIGGPYDGEFHDEPVGADKFHVVRREVIRGREASAVGRYNLREVYDDGSGWRMAWVWVGWLKFNCCEDMP